MPQDLAVPSFIFRGHVATIHALHFFSSNNYLASGDSDGWLVVWSLATKRPAAVWKGHDGGVMGLHDWGGDRLISHGRDHIVRVWQLRSQDFEGLDVNLPVDGISSIDNRQPWLLYSMAANALNYCAFTMCEEQPPKEEPYVEGNHEPVLLATPNGLDTGGIDIFQLPSQHRVNKKPATADIQTGMVMALKMFHYHQLNELMLIAGYESGHIMIYERTSIVANDWQWKTHSVFQPHTQPVLSLDITPDHRYFVSSSADALIVKFALPENTDAKGTVAKTSNTRHAGQQDLKVRDDGKVFATAGWDKRIRLYSIKTLRELAVLKWHQGGCYAVAFASVATANAAVADEAVDEDNRLTKSTIDLIKDKRIKQARDTHWLAAGGKDGKISLWDIY